MASPDKSYPRRSTIGAASSAPRDPAQYSADHDYNGSNSHNITVQEDEDRAATGTPSKAAKRRKNRNRKRRHRRQSFLAPDDGEEEAGGPVEPATAPGPDAVTNVNADDKQQQQQQQQQQTNTASTSGGAKGKTSKSRRGLLPFFGLGRDLSSTSLESEALLDHRFVSSYSTLELSFQMESVSLTLFRCFGAGTNP